MNEHNELTAHADLQRLADQRAEQLIALGADRGVARGVAAIELGLAGGDRIELDDREGRSGDLSRHATDEPRSSFRSSFARFAPSEGEKIPDMLPAMLMLPDHAQRTTKHGKASHAWRP